METLFVGQEHRQRVTDAEKLRLVLEFRQNGMKMKEWCIASGIGFSTFKRWLYKQKIGSTSSCNIPNTAGPSSSDSWTRMDIKPVNAPQTSSKNDSVIRIEAGAVRIFIASEAPVELLKAVLREVMPR